MIKNLLFFLGVSTFLCAEPSAFQAGNLSIDEPYGLTDNEKLLLSNIKTVKNLKRDKNTIRNEVDTLRVNVEGLRSLLESFNARFATSYKLTKQLLTSVDDIEQENVSQKNIIEATQKELIHLIALQKENYKNIEAALQSIEKNYVTKKHFKVFEDDMERFRTLVISEFKKMGLKSNSMAKKEIKTSNANAFNDGVAYFKQGKYEEAIEKFKVSIEQNHKPATAHYYAGEAYFQLKSYRNAFKFYKESYRRYQKGGYTPKLLLHSAISLEKVGSIKQADKFYKMVIKKFKDSEEAKIARSKISK